MSRIYLLFLLVCFSEISFAEKEKPYSHDKQFYFYWGYNRTRFTSSDLHFRGPDYDFTVYNASAHDRPSPFGMVYIDPGRMSIPQYNYRIGYFLSKHTALSFGMDHIKYVMDQNQVAKVTGIVNAGASEKYQGTYFNSDVPLSYDFLRFEHTNGFNLFALEAEHLFPLVKITPWMSLRWNLGFGGFWIITKTDVHVLDQGMDNDFHLAGYAIEMKAGPRLELWKKLFISWEAKVGYAVLPDVTIKNAAASDRANHNVGFLEKYIVVGKYFDLRSKGKRQQ